MCPLVEENEELNMKSVTKICEKYKNEIFKDYRVELFTWKNEAKRKRRNYARV